jgi:hypothetical protein
MVKLSKLYAELHSGLPRVQLQADELADAHKEVEAEPKLKGKVSRIVRITREELWSSKSI